MEKPQRTSDSQSGAKVILGLNTGHDAGACLLVNGQVVGVASEERFTRVKNDGARIPAEAIRYVLSEADQGKADVGALPMTMGFLPERYFVRETLYKEVERRVNRARKRAVSWFTGTYDEPMTMAGALAWRLRDRGKDLLDHFKLNRFKADTGFTGAEVSFVDHHYCHGLPAYYFSGWDRCGVITLDGVGDFGICHTQYVGEGGVYRPVHELNIFGISAGDFYAWITRRLGFTVGRHEGKITGLAAMGRAEPLASKLRPCLFYSEAEGRLASEFEKEPRPFDARWTCINEAIHGQPMADVAAAAQQVLEDAVVPMVRAFVRKTGCTRVGLSGGVFGNVKLNQRIMELPEVQEIFVFPAMMDTGNAVGAALEALARTDPEAYRRGRGRISDVYWGPGFGMDYIGDLLKQEPVKARRMDFPDLARTIARLIAEGKVVGVCQGRMEFGPRALGNRSILAAPTDPSINDTLNQRLDRSEFMPFAPSVLDGVAEDLFENVHKGRYTAKFMTVTFDVKPAWRERVGAVVHVDGTARPQIVSEQDNPRYFRIIQEYEKLSGIPAVLNTSFNVHEEPIICRPEEALAALRQGRVDALALEDYLVEP
jgi:carbamoyltransferase